MRTHPKVAAAASVGATLLGLAVTPYAQAADPPTNWTNQRVLDCVDVTLVAYLTPAGFGSAFHIEGSTDIIKPKHVEVVFPGTTDRVTTLDTPGFDRNDQNVVHCTYTDPDGLFVDLVGLRR